MNMKIQLIADLHFDGTSMGIEVCELMDLNTDEVLMDLAGVGGKVIQFLRDKGFDVHDLRAETAAIMEDTAAAAEDEIPGSEPLSPEAEVSL